MAADSGVVVTAGYHYSYGNYVVIDHGNGYRTLYAHASRLAVGYGQAVSQGQVIAYVGSTGNSYGNHCHFEVYVNGVPQRPGVVPGDEDLVKSKGTAAGRTALYTKDLRKTRPSALSGRFKPKGRWVFISEGLFCSGFPRESAKGAYALPTLPNSSIFSFYGGLDGLKAGSKQLAGVKALAPARPCRPRCRRGGGGKAELALGVYVDLGHAQADGLLDHIGGDAGAAVQHQGMPPVA